MYDHTRRETNKGKTYQQRCPLTAAQADLIVEEYDYAWAIARRETRWQWRDPDELTDTVHDALMSAASYHRDGSGSFRSFLYWIVCAHVHKSYSARMRSMAARADARTVSTEPWDFAADRESPAIDDRDECAYLRHVLTSRQDEIVEMMYAQGRSQVETARQIGRTQQCVATTHHRAILAMRERACL